MSAYGAVPGTLVRVAATAAVLAAAAPSQGVAVQERGSRETTDTLAGQTVGPGDSAAVHPAPPRTLFLGFVETDGRTLPRGQGHVAVGYLGASILVRRGDSPTAVPLVAQAAYGVTENVTVTLGSAAFAYNRWRPDFFIPYMAHKFRFLHTERTSVAFGHYLGIKEPTAQGQVVLFGASLAASHGVSDRVTLSLGVGAMGFTDHYDPGRFLVPVLPGGTVGSPAGRRVEADAVLAIGAEYAMRHNAWLVGEYRLIEPSRESGVVSVGLRLLGTTLAGELGMSMWIDDPEGSQPIVSVGYRF